MLVEEDSEIITAVETTPANAADCSQLPRLLKQQEETNSIVPAELSADKAYDSGANLELLDSKNITGNISLGRKSNHQGADLFTVEDFTYDAINDTLVCPAGNTAPYRRQAVFHDQEQQRLGNIFGFRPGQCNSCVLKEKCHRSNRGRTVYISYYEPLFQQMRERMASEAGQEAYHNRYKIEHKVADLVRYCGMRHCRYRGLVKAKIHALLAATASNIKRMARLMCSKEERPLLEMVAAC